MDFFYFCMLGLLLVGLNFCVEGRELIPDTDPKCPHQLYRVGLGTGAQFRELYRTCYDHTNMVAKYTQHTIYQPSPLANCARGVWRTSRLFTAQEAGFMRRSHIRSVTSATFPNYDRGHLAACADFPTAEERYATLEIINSLPQLSELNQGQWKRMESFLQNRENVGGVNVVTGGIGVLQYQGTPVYLDRSRPFPRYPIPEFMYKVARVNGAAQDELYVFIAYNYNGQVNQEHLDTYCVDEPCPIVLNKITCCKPHEFIEKILPDFKTLFGI